MQGYIHNFQKGERGGGAGGARTRRKTISHDQEEKTENGTTEKN